MKIKPFLLFIGVLSTLSVLEAQWVKAESTNAYATTGGLRMIPSLEPTDPMDPTHPNRPIHPKDPTDPNGPEPGTPGPLSIDFASSIDFGKNLISNQDKVYYAEPQSLVLEDGTEEAVANYVQITDHRGSNAGWHLQVKQDQQLENPEARYKVLTGAQLRLGNPKAVSNQSEEPGLVPPKTAQVVLIPGQSSEVMQASEGSGGGTWLDVFGKLNSVKVDQKEVLKNTAVTLSVPGKTPKDAVMYKSRLTWTLVDAPKV